MEEPDSGHRPCPVPGTADGGAAAVRPSVAFDYTLHREAFDYNLSVACVHPSAAFDPAAVDNLAGDAADVASAVLPSVDIAAVVVVVAAAAVVVEVAWVEVHQPLPEERPHKSEDPVALVVVVVVEDSQWEVGHS